MKLISVILVLFGFLLNSEVLEWIFPNARTDYYTWIAYVDLRNKIYECMFFFAFLFMFLSARGLIKAISAFGLFVTFSSAVDKCIYNIKDFIVTDYIVVIFALGFFVYVYYSEKKCKN